jgi:hypothetical protein
MCYVHTHALYRLVLEEAKKAIATEGNQALSPQQLKVCFVHLRVRVRPVWL